jgi:hypothetical protein
MDNEQDPSDYLDSLKRHPSLVGKKGCPVAGQNVRFSLLVFSPETHFSFKIFSSNKNIGMLALFESRLS